MIHEGNGAHFDPDCVAAFEAAEAGLRENRNEMREG